MPIQKKYLDLVEYIRSLKTAVVAFSGGVDSTFLLKAASEALGTNLKAMTLKTPYVPDWELDESSVIAKTLGVDHEILHMPIAESIKNNPLDRCYLCKKSIFETLILKATQQDYAYVLDGTNVDDLQDYRPGLLALKELGVKSPLMELGWTKSEIREMSESLNLPTWNKPPYACLLTRIPYNTFLREEDFPRIEQGERYLMSLGIRAVRLRCHNDLARIEVSPSEKSKLLKDDVMSDVSRYLKALGFHFVTLDLEGYRPSGSAAL